MGHMLRSSGPAIPEEQTGSQVIGSFNVRVVSEGAMQSEEESALRDGAFR